MKPSGDGAQPCRRSTPESSETLRAANAARI
jgi:hypothetical protein